MESPLSQEPSHILWRVIGINNLAEILCLNQVWRWDTGVISCFVLPPTSNDHIFRVRTFGVFLDSLERPLSQDSFHAPLEGSEFPQNCLKSMLFTKCACYLVVSM